MKKLSPAQVLALDLALRDGWVSPGKYWLAERTLEALARRGLLEEAVNPATGYLEYRPVSQLMETVGIYYRPGIGIIVSETSSDVIKALPIVEESNGEV